MPSKAAEAPSRPGRRWLAGALALLALAAAGWLAGLGRSSARSTAVTVPPVRTATAAVIRTDVVAQQQVPGTIGFADSRAIINQLPAGVLTSLPAPGAVIRRGQALFGVNGQPVTLCYGTMPAWRTLAAWVSDGPDVRELEQNLVALGADPYRIMTVDEHFTSATAAAAERWQLSLREPATGVVELGQVVFSPGPLRVTAVAAVLGASAAPGAQVLTASSTTPVVTVNLDPAFQSLVRPGSPVTVTLPDTATVPGHVTTVSRVAVTPVTAGGGSGGPPAAAIPVTIRLDHPGAAGYLDQAPVQVAITTQEARGVLAVPIGALLARPGGGFDVELVRGAQHRRVPVTVGLFDDTAGVVEVQGPPALRPGALVEVPAP